MADSTSSEDEGSDKRTVSLNYPEASWLKVLKDFAEATKTELVADRLTSKRFSRWDLKRYSRDDALKILNQALEPENFRLQFKGRYLILNNLKDLRHEYPAAVVRGDYREDAREASKPGSGVQTAAAEMPARAKTTSRGGSIKQMSGEADNRSATDRGPGASGRPVEPD